jgi:hypothetical protein
VFNRFYILVIYSVIVDIFDPACELLPHGRRNYTCVLLPLYLLSDLPLLPPSQTKCTVYTDSVWLWGGGWGVQEFYTLFLNRIRTYKIASPPETKMTSKDNIQGLVSLKFLRPWLNMEVDLQILFGLNVT